MQESLDFPGTSLAFTTHDPRICCVSSLARSVSPTFRGAACIGYASHHVRWALGCLPMPIASAPSLVANGLSLRCGTCRLPRNQSGREHGRLECWPTALMAGRLRLQASVRNGQVFKILLLSPAALPCEEGEQSDSDWPAIKPTTIHAMMSILSHTCRMQVWQSFHLPTSRLNGVRLLSEC